VSDDEELYAFLAVAERFLARHLGGRVEAITASELSIGQSTNHVGPLYSLRSPVSARTSSPEKFLCTFDLEVAKSCHKVLDLAGRRGFAGFEVALNA
jgi:hypothetical protein